MKYSSRLKKVFNRIEHMRKKATLRTALPYANICIIIVIIVMIISMFFCILH